MHALYSAHFTQIAKVTESTVTTHWEPATNVSCKLIKEFETTGNADIIQSYTSGGQTIHTVSTSSATSSCKSPNPKKSRIEISDTDKRYVLQCDIIHYTDCAIIVYMNVMY